LEKGSEHPLAEAIVEGARKRELDLPKAETFESVPGKGVQGTVGGQSLALGNDAMMQALGVETRWIEDSMDVLRSEGKTAMYVSIDGVLAGIVAVADPIKATTAGAIRDLHRLGLRVIMATGDNQQTAEAVASELGIDDVRAYVAVLTGHFGRHHSSQLRVGVSWSRRSVGPALSDCVASRRQHRSHHCFADPVARAIRPVARYAQSQCGPLVGPSVMIAAAIPFPDISPEIFTVQVGSLSLSLRWYAVAYIAGLLLGWRLCALMIRRPMLWPNHAPPIAPQQLENLLTWIILGVVLGGRLGFVIFYQPEYYLSRPVEILKIWQGGMSFHGGFLGVATATLVFALRNKFSILGLADLLAVAAPIGLLLGRIANFLNAELWGRPTALPWGVVFPGEAAQSCLGVDELCARHPSQLYEAVLEGLVLGAVLLTLALRRRWLQSPGALTGVFLTGYGFARGVVELLRQPDAQFVTDTNPIGHALHFGGWGVTMGQTLSLPMVVAGCILIIWARSGRNGGATGNIAKKA